MKSLILHLFTFILALPMAQARTPQEPPPTELAPVRVLGEGEAELMQPMQPTRIGKKEIENFKYTDVNRALKQAPGVYIREEDGQGLRPNIGLRGTNPDRSKKTVLMEDGVLVAPAPYSAPAAYYTPMMTHTSSLEVFKGFAALPYGPNSIGGAIEYISKPIPSEQAQELDANYASYNTSRLSGDVGGPLSFGGYMLHLTQLKSDGFKRIDFGGQTGFQKRDVLSKLRWNLNSHSSRVNELEARFGFTDEDSYETYVGVNEDDFYENPNRRYTASRKDEMQNVHRDARLTHRLQIGKSSLLKSDLYWATFHRSWYRLDGFRNGAISLRDVILNPGGTNEPYYNILKGAADSSSLGTSGQLKILNNDREYQSQGVQTQFTSLIQYSEWQHDFSVGFRLHQDSIDRGHTFDYYNVESGDVIYTGIPTQTLTRNNDSATAQTAHATDHISFKNWVFSIGTRWESVAFKSHDKESPNTSKRTDQIWAPGIGVLHKLSEQWSARTSVNRGATLSGINVEGGDSKETSTNYEWGIKYGSKRHSMEMDTVYFLNDYQNITGTCSASTNCDPALVDRSYSGGRARIEGLESRIARGWQIGPVWLPVQFNFTWIQAKFRNSFQSTNPEWGEGYVSKGAPLPYVPQLQYTLLLGTEYRAWTSEFAINYQTHMKDQSVETDRREVPAFGLIDWTGNYRWRKSSKVYAKIDNLLDHNYAASLRPYGYRPGKPRSFLAGVQYDF